ncbi:MULTISPECIES: hypothetical protein [Bradyrhizobium]|uniref:hypothetical protein n=1 Tax=Bradyrhizobium TaxID=374 RepID=UPI0020138885|nr:MULTISPECIES: hypothetical protein [Bradyrhizobium]
MKDEFLTVAGQHQVDAGALEIAVEDQVGIGNNEGARRNLAVALDGKKIDMAMGWGMKTLAIQGKRGVKLASVIQRGTVKALIFK